MELTITVGVATITESTESVAESGVSEPSVATITIVKVGGIGLSVTLGNGVGVNKRVTQGAWNCCAKVVDAWGSSESWESSVSKGRGGDSRGESWEGGEA